MCCAVTVTGDSLGCVIYVFCFFVVLGRLSVPVQLQVICISARLVSEMTFNVLMGR